MKIRTKMFITGLLLSILPLTLISAIILAIYDKELNDIATTDLKSITTAQIQIIDQFFQERDIDMSILSEYRVLHKLLEDSNQNMNIQNNDYKHIAEEFLLAEKNNSDFLNSIAVLDQKFRIVACTEPTAQGEVSLLKNTKIATDLGKEVWFSEVLEPGALNIRKRCLVAIKAIYNEKDEVIGYITEEITLEFIENLRITSDFIKEGSIYITDGVGNILSAGTANETRKEYILEKNERGGFSKAWNEREITDDVGVIKYKIGQKTYLSSYGGFHNSNWNIVTSICLNDILHARETIFQMMFFALLVTAIFLGSINRMMNKMLTYPIEEMLKTFSNIRLEKDFGLRIKNISSNELGVIANEVNSLLCDIETTIKHQEEKLKILKEQSERDPLTDLFNKNTIQEIFNMKIENSHVNKNFIACVLVDIDDFKKYNTNFGHAGGDKAIHFVASLMKELSNDTAGRIGGDEFVMFLDFKYSKEDIRSVMDEFLNRLKKGFDPLGDGNNVSVSCSIGVVNLSNHLEINYEVMVDLADKAMYEVKNNNKNGYSIYNED